MQTYDPITCRYVCGGFIGFIFKNEGLTDFINLFSPSNVKKNNKINFKLFSRIKMNETHVYGTKKFCLCLDNALRFGLESKK